MIPGEIITPSGAIEINVLRDTLCITFLVRLINRFKLVRCITPSISLQGSKDYHDQDFSNLLFSVRLG